MRIKVSTAGSFLCSVAAVLLLSTGSPDAGSGEKKASLIGIDRKEIGQVSFIGTPTGVLIRLELQERSAKISAGVHAVHLHETGRCEPPFKSAGAHLNPSNRKHGFHSEEGIHLGDLPNIHVPSKGALTVEILVPQASFTGGRSNLIDADGFALVIHQGADDYRSDPAGNSGDRVACAAIAGAQPAK